MSRNRITPRNKINANLKERIGKTLTSNLFSTLKGKLIYIQNDKCYFEILPNSEFTKYNQCAGQVDYLPEHMVICMDFDKE